MTSHLIKPFKLTNSMARSGISKELSQLPRVLNFNTSASRHMHCSSIRKGDVKTSLPYFDPASVKTKWVDTTVKDGRGQTFTVEKNGFELIKQVTSLSAEDFRNNKDKIHSTYYKELAEDIKKHLGAGFVQPILEPMVRKADDLSEEDTLSYSRGLFYIHSTVIDPMTVNIGKQYLKGRYMLFDVWRNINETPVAKNALAVCDIRSVKYPDDYALTKVKPTLALRLLDGNKDRHNWFYFSGMKKDEALMICQWDSENPNTKMCFHTAFHNPDAAPDAPTRESCDVRVLVFFPTKEPWNIHKPNNFRIES